MISFHDNNNEDNIDEYASFLFKFTFHQTHNIFHTIFFYFKFKKEKLIDTYLDITN